MTQNASITLNRNASIALSIFDNCPAVVTLSRGGTERQYQVTSQASLSRLIGLAGAFNWTYQEHSTRHGYSFGYWHFEAGLECAEDCQCSHCQLGSGGGWGNAPIIFVSNEDSWTDFEDAADLHEKEQHLAWLREGLYERCRTWDKQREDRIDFAFKHLVVPPPATVLVWTCPKCGFEHQHTFFGGLAECACGFRQEYERAIIAPEELEAAQMLYLVWLKADIDHRMPLGAGSDEVQS